VGKEIAHVSLFCFLFEHHTDIPSLPVSDRRHLISNFSFNQNGVEMRNPKPREVKFAVSVTLLVEKYS
jgi:hypothetical protein